LHHESNYHALWGLWDEFKNASILQLLQLHPADGGQGIAGKDFAVSLLIMGQEKYPNRVAVDRESKNLIVDYYTSDKGKGLMKRAKKNRILVRVFLSPNNPARSSLFLGDPTAVLFLPLMTVMNKKSDNDGIYFELMGHLAEKDFLRVKPSK